LIRTTTPSRAGTYAYVNPIVAVILGWALGGEPITGRVILTGSIVVLGVFLILRSMATSPEPAASRDAG